MLAGYLFPGRPLASKGHFPASIAFIANPSNRDLYFTCFTFNALQIGQMLARDFKLPNTSTYRQEALLLCKS